MRILFDTNVLVAAFMGGGASYEVIEQAIHDNEVFYTDFILGEFRRVFTQKFHYSETFTEEYIRFIRKFFLKGKTAAKKEEICRDPNDDQVLADAAVNEVDVIITGDKDLLVLKKHKKIKIITPKEYWEL